MNCHTLFSDFALGQSYSVWNSVKNFIESLDFFIGVNITFFPMHFLGLAGMPRRIPDYALQFTNFNMIITVGAFLFGFSQLLFLWNVIHTIKHGDKVTGDVWEGALVLVEVVVHTEAGLTDLA